MRGLPRSVSIRVAVQVPPALQVPFDHRLGHPIRYGRYSQTPPSFFGFLPLAGGGKYVPDDIRFRSWESCYSSRLNRRRERLRLLRPFLPLIRLSRTSLDDATPLLGQVCRRRLSYYGSLRPCASLRYSHPWPWSSPLPSRRQVPTFHQGPDPGCTPDAGCRPRRLQVSRGLFPGSTRPGSDRPYAFDTFPVVHSLRLLWTSSTPGSGADFLPWPSPRAVVDTIVSGMSEGNWIASAAGDRVRVEDARGVAADEDLAAVCREQRHRGSSTFAGTLRSSRSSHLDPVRHHLDVLVIGRSRDTQ